jgi:hypothetical protein
VGSLIRALDGKSLTPAMIKSWKARQLQRGHILALLRLADHRSDQVALHKEILAEKLSASMASFWCERMLTPAQRRLDRRSAAVRAAPGPPQSVDGASDLKATPKIRRWGAAAAPAQRPADRAARLRRSP